MSIRPWKASMIALAAFDLLVGIGLICSFYISEARTYAITTLLLALNVFAIGALLNAERQAHEERVERLLERLIRHIK